MKQKIFSRLCFVLIWAQWAHASVAHPVFAEDVTSPGVAQSQAKESASVAMDAYIPLIENYYSLVSDFLGMDYLYHESDPLVLPVKLFDFSNLLRRNIALLYAIRINKSRFACCVGGGLSSLSYVFRPEKRGNESFYKTLIRKSNQETVCEDVDPATHLGNPLAVAERSVLTIPYGDLLVRLRFNSVLDDPKRGFYGWLGAKISFRMNALTKIYYTEYDERSASLERVGTFNLNKLLVWLQGGVGYHRFGIVGGYSFSSLFKENQGPSKKESINPFAVGVCIDFF